MMKIESHLLIFPGFGLMNKRRLVIKASRIMFNELVLDFSEEFVINILERIKEIFQTKKEDPFIKNFIYEFFCPLIYKILKIFSTNLSILNLVHIT